LICKTRKSSTNTSRFSTPKRWCSTWGRSTLHARRPARHPALDGETVIDLDCDIGYLHRGMEKIAENRYLPDDHALLGRLDYVAAVSNGLLWVEAVEQMMQLEVPKRAHYMRTS
jgi:hypothetical protein